MPSPVFSIIVPVHNRAHIIHECLVSILAQTLGDFEIIVVDNNSTDNFDEILRTFADSRVIVTRCPTPGPSAARMHGVSLSKGKYLSFIDSDDVWRNDVLEQVAKSLESQDRPVAVYLSTVIFRPDLPVDWNSKPTARAVMAVDLIDALWKGAPGACALAGVHRNLFEDGKGFAEELWVGEDVDWAMRNASAGPVSLLLDEPRLGYRRHDENITKDSGRYAAWAHELLEFATNAPGRYAITGNPSLRKYIVTHLMGQLQTILRMRSFASFLRIYPRVLLLGLRWRVLRPLWMPSLFASYFENRAKVLKATSLTGKT